MGSLTKDKVLLKFSEKLNGLELKSFENLINALINRLYTSKENFNETELQKLQELLDIDNEADLKQLLNSLFNLFKEITYHQFKQKELFTQLSELNFNQEQIKIILISFKSNGQQLINKCKLSSEQFAVTNLDNVNWKIKNEICSKRINNLNNLIGQIDLVFNENANEKKLSLDFNHNELYAFYTHLETIQNQVDSLLK